MLIIHSYIVTVRSLNVASDKAIIASKYCAAVLVSGVAKGGEGGGPPRVTAKEG